MAGNAKAIRDAAARAAAAMRGPADSRSMETPKPKPARSSVGETPKPRAPRASVGETPKPRPDQMSRDAEAFQLRGERAMERRVGVRGNPAPRIPKAPVEAAEVGERGLVKATSRAVARTGGEEIAASVVSRGARSAAMKAAARRVGGAIGKASGPIGVALAAKDVYDAGKWAQKQGDASPRTMPTKARSGGMTVHPTPTGSGPKAESAHGRNSGAVYAPNMTKTTHYAKRGPK